MSVVRCCLVVCALLVTACDPYPKDPRKTLETIEREGVLWAGMSEHLPWTREVDGEAVGIEPALVEELAGELGVEVRWSVMSEAELSEALQHGEIQIAVAGYTKKTPWSKHVGLSRPYVEVGKEKHVVAVQKGENRWLLRVERFLDDKAPRVLRTLDAYETVALP